MQVFGLPGHVIRGGRVASRVAAKAANSKAASRNHRALAVEDAEELVWIWIGTHADYERLVG